MEVAILNLHFIEEEAEMCKVKRLATEVESQALNTGLLTPRSL